MYLKFFVKITFFEVNINFTQLLESQHFDLTYRRISTFRQLRQSYFLPSQKYLNGNQKETQNHVKHEIQSKQIPNL